MRSLRPLLVAGVLVAVAAAPSGAAVAVPELHGSASAAATGGTGTCPVSPRGLGTRMPIERSGTFTDQFGADWTFSVRGCGVLIPRTGGHRLRAMVVLEGRGGVLTGRGTGSQMLMGNGIDGTEYEFLRFTVRGAGALAAVQGGKVGLDLRAAMGSWSFTGTASMTLRGCTVCSS